MLDEEAFMMGFGYLYSTIKNYANIKPMPVQELIKQGKKNGKLMGEFAASNGETVLEFSALKETINFTQHFLNSGEFDIRKSDEISNKLESWLEKWAEFISGMIKSKDADENLEGVPLPILSHGYAIQLLDGLKMISEIEDYPTRNNRRALLKETINNCGRKFNP